MRPIPWEMMAPQDVEDAISALLVRIVPGARRVDGSGGDDGADVVAVANGSLHIYEVKSFTGRLSPGRKSQILKSLRVASAKRPNMAGWTLVLPMDFSPAEERWFESDLSTVVSVPVQCLGRTWLDVQFAQRPDLDRAFVPGGNEAKALQLLASYQQEKAGLGNGLPDAIERAQALRGLTDSVDPDYAFDLAFTNGTTSVSVRPKDADAPNRRPITASLGFKAEHGSAAAHDIDSFHRFGSGLSLGPNNVADVHLDLPAELARLVPKGAAVSITLTPNPGPRTRVRVSALQDGRATQRLTMTVDESTRGSGGGQRIYMVDDTNILSMEYFIDSHQSECKVGLRIPSNTHPGDALPSVSFLACLMQAAAVRIELPGALPVTARLGSATVANFQEVQQIARDLELLEQSQEITGHFLGSPRLTGQDRQALRMANEFWAGNSVDWVWIPRWIPIEGGAALEWCSLSGFMPRVSMTGTGPDSLPLAETSIPLPGRLEMSAKDLIVGNMAELRRLFKEHGPAGSFGVLLVADDQSTVTFSAEKN
ncbi:hypothetical protein [Oryzihumus leptocrescens]|uniref:Restriction endonuclease n=1 Tax=Oryzihumus leptocrescens TaxID=297536 RepID=A0A542ZI96_9MICO|nr:hypothetical protein [Oryzihumus leptocrescens]TQL60088.1 hypothetical protein FB474_1465 [Oryzihumus leptocrescens]